MRQRKPVSNFTLIELLIVIAIIAILASMLLPALGKARQKGWDAACRSNLKGTGLALTMYLDDNQQYFPARQYNSSTVGDRWYDVLNKYLGGWTVLAKDPAARPTRAVTNKALNFFNNSAIMPYGANGYAFRDYDASGSLRKITERKCFNQPAMRIAIGDTPASGENLWDGSPVNASARGSKLNSGDNWDFRHAGKRANMLFMDGHAGTQPALPVGGTDATSSSYRNSYCTTEFGGYIASSYIYY